MMKNPILTIKGLSKAFVSDVVNHTGILGQDRISILKGIDLKVQRNSVTTLLGGNGTGKTTLFNMISGLDRPDSGEIVYHHANGDTRADQMAPYRLVRLGIGRLLQHGNIFKEMSVLDNMLIAVADRDFERPLLTLLNRRRFKKQRSAMTERALGVWSELLGKDNPFADKKNEAAGTLSYGQQRLLSFTRLFMQDYDLILLDEPSSGVNPMVKEQIIAMILQLKASGKTVFMIEHDPDMVRRVADQAYCLADGKVAAFASAAEIDKLLISDLF